MAFNDFGKTVKKTLVDMEKTQEWLIKQVTAETGLYFDSSYLHKTLTGKNNNPNIINAIKNILGI